MGTGQEAWFLAGESGLYVHDGDPWSAGSHPIDR